MAKFAYLQVNKNNQLELKHQYRFSEAEQAMLNEKIESINNEIDRVLKLGEAKGEAHER